MSVAGAADALADRGEDIEEHEHEQEGLYDSAQAEDDDVLAQHHEVAPHKCPQRAPAGGDGRPDRAETDLLAVGDEPGGRRRLGFRDLLGGGRPGRAVLGRLCSYRHQSRSSLPVRAMNTVSSVGSEIERSLTTIPASSATFTTRGSR